ncbi:MAG: hypothetical protein K8S94_13410 [Planctomycetia bacterium]|nr:hypothetical protein [Planctomycetia bacterium]
MARRHIRHGRDERPRRRWGAVALIALAVGGASWIAPAVLVRTPLRDRPLAAAFAGIDGSITSAGATWGWLDGVEYRDVVLRDRSGRAAVIVPRIVIDRGILRLAIDRSNLGTVRLIEPEALVEVRSDGSSLEDILAAWLASSGRAPALELEVLGATVELIDTVRSDAWRLTDVIAAGTLRADGLLSGWTAAGRLRHSDRPHTASAAAAPTTATAEPVRLDRSTIPTAAAAVLVRDGGWSLSSPAVAADGSRTVTVAAHKLPLGASSVVATRFGLSHLLDGIADLRLDVTDDASGRHVQGDATIDQLAVCDSVALDERFAIERCTIPFELSLEPGRIMVRRFAATSPMFHAEASGGLRLPRNDVRRWAEELVGEDFTVALDVDLAAASRGLPGGLMVRPDVRVSGGSLRFAATARADGDDRLLEVRATARDLAAVQGIAQATREASDKATDQTAGDASAAAAGEPPAARERQLSWPEPFTAWLKGRRVPGRDERLRIEEARLVSKAVEVSAAGTPAALAVQWTADIGGLVGELTELLDLGTATATGRSRGRIDIGGDPGTSSRSMKVSASVAELELALPGRPVWRDADITLEMEGTGSMTSAVAAIEQARGVLTCGDDRLEASVSGGVLVDGWSLLGFGTAANVPCVRPAANAESVTAECSLTGDLDTWHPRLAVVVPPLADPGLELSGKVAAAAAVSPQGDAWQWKRAGGEIEKFTARWQGREISEPRVVVTAAGRLQARTGQVDITSGEILTATVSLRTGGLSWMPGTTGGVVDRLRGRLQWQADVGRIEPWFLPATVAASLPTAGRAWGTLEIVDTQAGTNVLFESTGSQLSLSSAGGGVARPMWSEPRLALAVEVTRPLGGRGVPLDEVRIDRIALESSTLAMAAKGRVGEWSTRRIVELDGTAAYDWTQISRLLMPLTGGRVRLAGSGGRPFSLRGPLGSEPRPAGSTAAAAPVDTTAALPLPENWLAATRGSESERVLTARMSRSTTATSVPTTDERLLGLAIDTSATWTAGNIDGFALSSGEVAIRLLEGQLAFGPFDLPAAGGRLRGAPWIRLVPWPGELVVPPGRIAESIQLSGPLCERFVKWLSPVLGHSTHAAGAASIDLAGARLPLGDAFGGELAGQVVFENLEVTSSPTVQPLVNLIVKLQSVIDPRFAFGDKAVLMRVRPDPVRVRLAGRRLAHEGLVMDAGQLVVRSQGSVAEDGQLDMQVEVAFRGDLVGQTPVIGQLFRTPLLIPLKGTVHKPQFDARSIDLILGRIVENTAQAVLGDGIGRGLEALFGKPEPSAAPAASPAGEQPSLTLPGAAAPR